MPTQQRFEQLDSLRGIAAVIVVFYHFLLILKPANTLIWHVIYRTPMRILISGTQSVVFFFVLSGFVLSLSFLGSSPPNYPSYIVKRIFRLYAPYAVAVSVAIAARLAFSKGGISGLGGWFNQQWMTPLTPSLVIKHFALVFNFNNYALDGVVWSLIHEMRISIIFPLMMLFIVRVNWKWVIGSSITLSIIGILFQHHFHSSLQPWYKTLPYIFTFTVGVYVAKYRGALTDRYIMAPQWAKGLLLILGFMLFGSTQWFHRSSTIDDLETIAGSVILIVAALTNGWFSGILLFKPIKFIGKVSYSLYLYHVIVLLSLVNLLDGKIPLYALLLISFVTSLVVAFISWAVVERPCIHAGRAVSRYFARTATVESVTIGNMQDIYRR